MLLIGGRTGNFDIPSAFEAVAILSNQAPENSSWFNFNHEFALHQRNENEMKMNLTHNKMSINSTFGWKY